MQARSLRLPRQRGEVGRLDPDRGVGQRHSLRAEERQVEAVGTRGVAGEFPEIGVLGAGRAHGHGHRKPLPGGPVGTGSRREFERPGRGRTDEQHDGFPIGPQRGEPRRQHPRGRAVAARHGRRLDPGDRLRGEAGDRLAGILRRIARLGGDQHAARRAGDRREGREIDARADAHGGEGHPPRPQQIDHPGQVLGVGGARGRTVTDIDDGLRSRSRVEDGDGGVEGGDQVSRAQRGAGVEFERREADRITAGRPESFREHRAIDVDGPDADPVLAADVFQDSRQCVEPAPSVLPDLTGRRVEQHQHVGRSGGVAGRCGPQPHGGHARVALRGDGRLGEGEADRRATGGGGFGGGDRGPAGEHDRHRGREQHANHGTTLPEGRPTRDDARPFAHLPEAYFGPPCHANVDLRGKLAIRTRSVAAGRWRRTR